jgi:hypothetical protein
MGVQCASGIQPVIHEVRDAASFDLWPLYKQTPDARDGAGAASAHEGQDLSAHSLLVFGQLRLKRGWTTRSFAIAASFPGDSSFRASMRRKSKRAENKAHPAKMATKVTRTPAKSPRAASRLVDEIAQGAGVHLFDPCGAVHNEIESIGTIDT